ncbi:MAG TPA: MFS transporter [Bryobacteraceae bacterium]|nr:MFS transporter [Bryobacteraceae bacterium]
MRSHDAFAVPREVEVKLGLRENWKQFSLLVVVNAFVGSMAGMERVVFPLLAEREFGIVSRAAILSFIVSFGLTKAFSNLFAGSFSDRAGRKIVLVVGWLFALPIPLLIFYAPSWGWIVFANVLLGLNQGLCWSTTVIMKIDLAGPKSRGLAMGLNEAAGYLAVSLAALGSGYLAGVSGLRSAPLYIGGVSAAAGLFLSAAFVRESRDHVRQEAKAQPVGAEKRSFSSIFWTTSWKDRALFSVSQAGMINNLNDGMAWGLFPLYFASRGLTLREISVLGAIYPAVWGLTQLGTGALSDRIGRKGLIVGGMLLQGVSIILLVLSTGFPCWIACCAFLGAGTAMVYPTLLAAIGDVAHASWRASAVGVYRLWRDSGYAIGALMAGVLADRFGMSWAIGAVGALTLLSGIIVASAMYETHPVKSGSG